MKKIFIGSSSEELEIANKVKTYLEENNEFEVTIWNENNIWEDTTFKLNNNYLNALLERALMSDFGILIGTPDDEVIYRGEKKLQPRDNVLFEFGLFIGRLGINNCAFLIDKNIHVLSDVQGITLARADLGNDQELLDEVKKIRIFFKNQSNNEINFFPSTTLASVYYENFIKPTCLTIVENKNAIIDMSDTRYENCIVEVFIPKEINSDVNFQFQKIKNIKEIQTISFNYKGRPRSISVDVSFKNEKTIIIDFPTIISGIKDAIDNLLPKESQTCSKNYNRILERELNRFINTLELLIKKGGFDNIVKICVE